MFSYEVFRIIWWILLGVLLMGFAIMDGYDMGVGALVPFLGKTDKERRVMINSMGPYWESNQVWLILGGGAVFAAWPHVYSMAFSGFYFAILTLLALLIIRPVCFKFRGKHKDESVRRIYDWGLCLSGALPPLLCGVAVGNIFIGANFQFDPMTMFIQYKGTGLFELLHPFALLCGLVSLSFSLTQGATYLACKADDIIAERAKKLVKVTAPITIVLFIIGGIWLPFLDGFQVVNGITGGPSNPLMSGSVEVVHGAWAMHMVAHPYLYIVPILGILATAVTMVKVSSMPKFAMITNSFAIMCIIGTAGVTAFPFLMPSSLSPNSSLTVWNASSSKLSLEIMLCAVIIFLPIVLFYIGWVIRVMRGRVTLTEIESDETAY